MNNSCAYCGKSLDGVRQLHVLKQNIYCSKECAVTAISSEILSTLQEVATERYNEYVTIVDRSARGMSGEEIMNTIIALERTNKRCAEWLDYFSNMPDEEQHSCLVTMISLNFKDAAALLRYIGA